MLRCPCEILKPFSFATSSKPSVQRCNSVLRIPLGYSCYHRKAIFVQIGRNKQCIRKEWELKKSFLKQQKSFIWTSFLLFKDTNEKPNAENLQTTNTSNIGLNKKLIDFTEDCTKKPSIESHTQTTILRDSTPIFGSIDTVEVEKTKLTPAPNSLKDKNINSMNIEKPVLQTILLSQEKIKEGGMAVQTIPGIQSQVLIKPVKFDSEVQKCAEKPADKVKMSEKKEDVKRQIQEINLGGSLKEIKLEEPPAAGNSETGRVSVEIKPSKDSSSKLLLEKAKNILRKTTSLMADDDRNPKVISLGGPKGDININTTVRRRQTVDLNRCSTERNFITPVRAMTDFLLKPSDLEGLRKTKRRSPYENDPPITVYWRKDVEAKALDVWGSKENLLKEILKRDIERRRYQQNLFTVKRRLRDYRREQGRESEIKLEQNGLFGSSGKVVLTAIAINGTNFLFKLIAWLYTGSHSMFSEAVHSLADTINQLILAYGIHKSVQRADSDHPYGYTNMRYVASLISGVGIFCVGSGLSFYHGFMGLIDPSDLPSFYWAYLILGGSLASEGATLLVAFNSIRLGAKKLDMSFSEYVLRGQDPSVNVVLLEDFAAVIGVIFAGSCMGLSSYYNSHIPDAIGSFLVGGLLAGVASFIIYTNVAALVGRSIPQERLDKINAELESDVMIRAIHDVKGIDIGNSLVRYKAEMDFDGGELTRSYLDKQDLNQLLEEVRKMQTIDELEEFMLKHGENIVDMMGGEIDRIELKLRKKHPEIRHCDLEIL